MPSKEGLELYTNDELIAEISGRVDAIVFAAVAPDKLGGVSICLRGSVLTCTGLVTALQVQNSKAILHMLGEMK